MKTTCCLPVAVAWCNDLPSPARELKLFWAIKCRNNNHFLSPESDMEALMSPYRGRAALLLPKES